MFVTKYALQKNDVREEITMPEKTEDTKETEYRPQDHPWVEMPTDYSVDETIRYSLDEIRLR